jgi:SAM-dependent methyltransferase
MSTEEIRQIDLELARVWGIDFYPRDTDLEDLLEDLDDQSAVEEFHDAHDEAAIELAARSPNTGARADARVYDAIAHPQLIGPVTSRRRHFILDAIAVGIGISTYLGLTGTILDAGCHAGFVTNILADRLKRQAVGIDPSKKAIDFAMTHPARSSRCEFVQARIPWETDLRFDLAFAIDSMPQNKAGDFYLRALAELLRSSGVAVIASDFWARADARTRKELKRAGLGFGYADVLGGYGHARRVPSCFICRSDNRRPRGAAGEQFTATLGERWHLFCDYANASGTPVREKTQAFERAQRATHSRQ